MDQAVRLGVGDDAVPAAIVTCPAVWSHAEEVPIDPDLVASTAVKAEDVPIALTDHVLWQSLLLAWGYTYTGCISVQGRGILLPG